MGDRTAKQAKSEREEVIASLEWADVLMRESGAAEVMR